MYTAGPQDRVVALPELPAPAADVPDPMVLSNEHAVVLSYATVPLPPMPIGLVMHIVDPAAQEPPIAMVRFHACRIFSFGAPSDEGLAGHPLFGRGLRLYAAHEVQPSSWIRELERRNRVHPRHDPAAFERLRHFVLTFHDSTFEGVATGFTVSLQWDSAASRLSAMDEALRARGPANGSATFLP